MSLKVNIELNRSLAYPIKADTPVASISVTPDTAGVEMEVLNVDTEEEEPAYDIDTASMKVLAARVIEADAPGFFIRAYDPDSGEYGLSRFVDINIGNVHDLGEFPTIYAAMSRYPNGGSEGDFITILGVQHFWDINRKTWGILKDKEHNLSQMIEDFIRYVQRWGWAYAGIAVPSTLPKARRNIFYIASMPGTYKHFDGLRVEEGEVAILRYAHKKWVKDVACRTGSSTGGGEGNLSPSEGCIFSESAHIESVEPIGDDIYKLYMRREHEGDVTGLEENDICYSVATGQGESGQESRTSWMRVLARNEAENSLVVKLYPDGEVPGGQNHVPAAGFPLVHRGNARIPAEGELPNQRAQVWMLSASEGRMMFLKDVHKPILEDANYVLVAGRLPSLSVLNKLPVGSGEIGIAVDNIVVKNLYRYDNNGEVVPAVVDRGQWSADTAKGDAPYRNIYYDATTPLGEVHTLLERHTVYHYGCKYGCVADKTTQEPGWDSTGWELLEGDPCYYVEFNLPQDYSVRPGHVNLQLTALVRYANRNITDGLMAAQGTEVEWSRDTGYPDEDILWEPQHVDGMKNVIQIDGSDAHGVGTGFGYKYRSLSFTCKIALPPSAKDGGNVITHRLEII